VQPALIRVPLKQTLVTFGIALALAGKQVRQRIVDVARAVQSRGRSDVLGQAEESRCAAPCLGASDGALAGAVEASVQIASVRAVYVWAENGCSSRAEI
jgi:hypothetical protein